MNFFSPDNLRAAAAGTWLARPGPSSVIQGVTSDSRSLKPGNVFIALRGDTHDGHDFTSHAARAGASILIVERDDAAPIDAHERGVGVLKVADTRKALLRLGAACRKTLDTTRVIAVAGSNGKTTTVRLLHSVLSTRLRGTASPKSYNNDIGVPLTLLSARSNDQYLICEVGTNAPGEIAALARIVEPDIAVIVSLGREHLAGLGSIEGVAREESQMLAAIRPGGVAVLTADTPALRPLIPPGPAAVLFGRAADADLRLTAFEHAPGEGGRAGIRFTVNNRWTFAAPLAGEHNALNCLAVIAVARRFNIDDDLIAAGLSAAAAPEMRWQESRIGELRIVNDAYNANPESMLAAIRTFASTASTDRRRIVVLGDMLELGDASGPAHREIARALIDLRAADAALLVGPAMAAAADELRRAWPADRVTHLPSLDGPGLARAADALAPGDTVLLKGSRGMRLERIAAELSRRAGLAPASHQP